MKTEIQGTRQTVCNSCNSVIGTGYYPEKRGSISLGLKNHDGDMESHDYCSEGCLRASLNARHDARVAHATFEDQEISFGRDGMVTLDFSKTLKEKKA